MSGGGETAHVDADPGDQDLGEGQADPGNGDQQVLLPHGLQLTVDLLAQAGDPVVGLVDGPQHRSDHESVVPVEATGQGTGEQGDLALQTAQGERCQHLRVPFACHQGIQHGPRRAAGDVGDDRGQLDPGVFQEHRETVHVAGPVRYRVRSRS
nr:hypothetical protein OG999_00965 [Streptomyces sp. NBC_00886]